MLWYLLLTFVNLANACHSVWHTPTAMFPENLIELRFDERFIRKQRHLYNPGLRIFSGGLDKHGATSFDIVFKKDNALHDIIYNYVVEKPDEIWQPVDLSDTGPDIVLKHVKPSDSLEYAEILKVWVSARSPCLPTREIARVAYDFNVTATYELYHCYDNTLNANASKTWTERGWISDASIVLHPTVKYFKSITRHYVKSPCGQAWVDSSLRSVNTSQYSFWNLETGWWVSNRWVGHENRSIPRCHKREHGNVCSIIATVRLTYRNCYAPVVFSVSQSVSHIARMTRHSYATPTLPSNFDAERRLPVPDLGDMRYDMCEARACEDDSVCTPLHIENRGLMHDGNISISQHDFFHTENKLDGTVGPVARNGYIETQCKFEVIGFMDDIWSPHIYFRQWVGYNYTML